ncbi:Uncharacterised protein [Acinetobacter baumannii]|nr:Uncharacterised protein [Acinetobacter baumannii]
MPQSCPLRPLFFFGSGGALSYTSPSSTGAGRARGGVASGTAGKASTGALAVALSGFFSASISCTRLSTPAWMPP